MLVPRTRLIVWTALIVPPFAAVAATRPEALMVSLAIMGGLAAAVLADAFLAPRRLAGIRVLLPALTRLQKDRPGEIELRIENTSAEERLLRVGLAAPPEIGAHEDSRGASLSAGATLSRFPWPVTPQRRGQYFLENPCLEAASPLGFWSVRTTQAGRAELRVYPDLFSERKHVAALFLRRGELGAHAQRQAGQGRVFEKLREYVPGDSYDEIHWKASAKRAHPVTKVFQVERTQEVYVVIDASRLSGREMPCGAGRTTPLERFVTAALILGAAAERQGDRFGLMTFSDRVLSFVRAKNGAAHYSACRDRIYTLTPQRVSPDFEEACSFIRLRLRKRALLIFLTSLDDPVLAESFAHSVPLICRQHLVLVDMLQPARARPVFTEEPADTEALYAQLAGHLQWSSLREFEQVLRRRGVRFTLLDPEKLSAQLVAQHAEVKRRQLL